MNEFKVGDRVRTISGLYAGAEGVIAFIDENCPDFCRVQYDGCVIATDEFTYRLELIKKELKLTIGDRVKILRGMHRDRIGKILAAEFNDGKYWYTVDLGTPNKLNAYTESWLEPAPSAKDIKVTFKLTGAEAFIESAKQLIEALEALEVKIDDERDKNTN